MIKNKQLASILTIAGTDPTSGAGIQADIKAISATGAYAANVITALVAQNTQGVLAIETVSQGFIQQQLHAVFTDLSISAVKIGMMHDSATVNSVCDVLQLEKVAHLVVDPVMIAKDGSALMRKSTLTTLKKRLFALATVITPNIPEAEVLLEQPVTNQQEMAAAATELAMSYKMSVLVKGGHASCQQSADVLFDYSEQSTTWYQMPRVDTENTHGTGCSLSAAIASYLGQGLPLNEAVASAKAYVSQAIEAGIALGIGKGRGPIDHFYMLRD